MGLVLVFVIMAMLWQLQSKRQTLAIFGNIANADAIANTANANANAANNAKLKNLPIL